MPSSRPRTGPSSSWSPSASGWPGSAPRSGGRDAGAGTGSVVAWFLRACVAAGAASVAALELGWITTELGRQPWIAYRHMRVVDAVTGNEGVWVTFVVLTVVYVALGIGTALVLRSMARRWRAGEPPDLPTPYSPGGRVRRREPCRRSSPALLFVGVLAYAVFAGADFGSGVWDLTAGGDERGAPLRTLIDHVIGPVWEANHVWLVYVLVFLWTGFPAVFAAVCTTFFVPLSLAGLGHRGPRLGVRVPQAGPEPRHRPAARRTLRDVLGGHAVPVRLRGRRHRRRPGPSVRRG